MRTVKFLLPLLTAVVSCSYNKDYNLNGVHKIPEDENKNTVGFPIQNQSNSGWIEIDNGRNAGYVYGNHYDPQYDNIPNKSVDMEKAQVSQEQYGKNGYNVNPYNTNYDNSLNTSVDFTQRLLEQEKYGFDNAFEMEQARKAQKQYEKNKELGLDYDERISYDRRYNDENVLHDPERNAYAPLNISTDNSPREKSRMECTAMVLRYLMAIVNYERAAIVLPMDQALIVQVSQFGVHFKNEFVNVALSVVVLLINFLYFQNLQEAGEHKTNISILSLTTEYLFLLLTPYIFEGLRLAEAAEEKLFIVDCGINSQCDVAPLSVGRTAVLVANEIFPLVNTGMFIPLEILTLLEYYAGCVRKHTTVMVYLLLANVLLLCFPDKEKETVPGYIIFLVMAIKMTLIIILAAKSVGL